VDAPDEVEGHVEGHDGDEEEVTGGEESGESWRPGEREQEGEAEEGEGDEEDSDSAEVVGAGEGLPRTR
jgi:hypothetical protein